MQTTITQIMPWKWRLHLIYIRLVLHFCGLGARMVVMPVPAAGVGNGIGFSTRYRPRNDIFEAQIRYSHISQ